MRNQRFTGTDQYVATDELMMAVNGAITLARPLYEWHIKSTSKATQGLYEYDAVSRLRDSQLGDARVHDIKNYIVKGRLWEAFDSLVQPVLLIDEIDKRASWCKRGIVRSSSSPATTSANCPMRGSTPRRCASRASWWVDACFR
jgi:hypothetical protein